MFSTILAALDAGTIWEIGLGIGGLILALVSILVTIRLAVQSRQSKVLTYEKLSDTAIIDKSKDLGHDVHILLGGREVKYMRLVNLDIASSGNAMIDPSDYTNPLPDPSGLPGLLLDFGMHEVIRYAIHSTTPSNLFPRDRLNDLLQEVPKNPNQLFLRGIPLNPRDSLQVKVFCLKSLPPNMKEDDYASLPDKAREVKVTVFGQIKECPIKEYVPKPPRFTRGRIGIAVSILLAATFLLMSFYGLGVGNIIQGRCGVGAIQDSGSTAFYSTALSLAQAYHSDCVLGNVTVSESNSYDGLSALKNGQIQVANSELFAQEANPQYAGLQDHQVAAIIFVLIVNRDVQGVENLSSGQIQQIYNGSVQNWQQISPSAPNLPIKVIERPSGSGTLVALSKYLLHGQDSRSAQIINVKDSTQDVVNAVASTPGAIGYVALSAAAAANRAIVILDIDGQVPGTASIEAGQYPYWAIEHLYTQPNPGPLVNSFINFVMENTQTGATFIRLSDLSPALLQTR
jgi:phosphate transport system substrate-binding protein